MPDKVEIPERYVPDSDDEVTEEEAMIRQEKSEKYRKLLAAQRCVQFVGLPVLKVVVEEKLEYVLTTMLE